jgi:prolyl 4-hydroxylase
MIVQSPPGRPYVDGDSLDFSRPLLWTVDDVLSVVECAALIERIEAIGPTAAPITTAHGFKMRPDIRNNTRVMIDDAELAELIFQRVHATVPVTTHGNWRASGANERLRCYRYTAGQRFALHYDGAFVRNDREESFLTLMVYLNEGFRGGATEFPDIDVTVTPKTGRALLFQHRQLHQGCVVEEGVKYAIRSDVMFRR